jgi:hypothetical protein
MAKDWRLQLALVLAAALLLRVKFFVGFGLGDDLGYIGYADKILAGSYPALDLLNQYAYRPLLLYLFAAGIAIFGHTDLGVVAPVLLASLVTTALVFIFVRKLIDPAAAVWCGLLFAFEPFNVVNSTTMTNDVILACLVFASIGAFVLADRETPSRSRGLFTLSAALMLAAFLVKIACAPAIGAIALYSMVALRQRPTDVVKRHSFFYVSLLLGLFAVCLGYYVKKGDLFWQIKAETFYYETYKPAWYVAGFIDYANLMWEYPRSLLWLSGSPSFRYLDHGLLFWLVLPAAILAMRRGNDWLRLLVATLAIVFLFFQFYPQYLSPRYLPLVRQERYLEMLIPASTVVVGWALHSLSRRHRSIAVAVLAFVLVDSVVEASRRSTEYDDSQQDMRELARYASTTVAHAGGRLVVDLPAKNAMTFYLRDVPVETAQFQSILDSDLRQCYVAVGGARSFWWSRTEIADVDPASVPPHWILTYEVSGRPRPWRPSTLRVYYVSEPAKDWYTVLDSPLANHLEGTAAGLTRSSFADGFEGQPVAVDQNQPIGDIDNATRLTASHLQWAGWMHATDAVYTFETKSDDGSWIYVNDEVILDNGGTHPAKTMRRTVRLADGWYRFRLRYEDAGGDRFLQFRVYKNYMPAALPQSELFFSQRDRLSAPDAPASKGRS